jgi:hypothetical protein
MVASVASVTTRAEVAEGAMVVVLFDMPSLYASLSRYQANICN